jgi:hypothetical protein
VFVLHIGCRLAGIRRARCYVDKGNYARVITSLGYDGPSIPVTYKHHRTPLSFDDACGSVDILRERGQWVLNCDHPQPLDLKERNNFTPSRGVNPRAMNNGDGGGVEVTRHVSHSCRATSARLHLALP